MAATPERRTLMGLLCPPTIIVVMRPEERETARERERERSTCACIDMIAYAIVIAAM